MAEFTEDRSSRPGDLKPVWALSSVAALPVRDRHGRSPGRPGVDLPISSRAWPATGWLLGSFGVAAYVVIGGRACRR